MSYIVPANDAAEAGKYYVSPPAIPDGLHDEVMSTWTVDKPLDSSRGGNASSEFVVFGPIAASVREPNQPKVQQELTGPTTQTESILPEPSAHNLLPSMKNEVYSRDNNAAESDRQHGGATLLADEVLPEFFHELKLPYTRLDSMGNLVYEPPVLEPVDNSKTHIVKPGSLTILSNKKGRD